MGVCVGGRGGKVGLDSWIDWGKGIRMLKRLLIMVKYTGDGWVCGG